MNKSENTKLVYLRKDKFVGMNYDFDIDRFDRSIKTVGALRNIFYNARFVGWLREDFTIPRLH